VIRVLALVPYPTGRAPGQRFRIEQWAPLLDREQVEIDIRPFLRPEDLDVLYLPGHSLRKAWGVLRGQGRRVHDIQRRDRHQVAYVYREAGFLPATWVERTVSRRVPLLYDFDDAIYLPAASAANAWVRALRSPRKVDTLCRLAAHVTVGNGTLAAWARERAEVVTVVPSTIDTEVYREADRPPNLRPVVGWTGSGTTVPYLELLGPALRELRRHVDFELRVIGPPLEMPGVDIRLVPWRAATEVADLHAMDVGLMPLPDDEWARGKCGLKALQYMACGIPPVVSPVGVNASIVQDGVTGFHARTSREWVDRVLTLLENATLRATLGCAARRVVEESYSARVHVPRLAAILRELGVRRRGTPGREGVQD
jgi:glycosyltransferase involved in cell wall biosynthesis